MTERDDPDAHRNQEPRAITGPVVLAYDGSAGADHAIRVAATLLSPGAAIVVTAWEPPSSRYADWSGDPMFLMPTADPEAASAVDGADAARAAAVADRGAGIASEAGFGQVSARAESKIGREWRTILAVADEVDASAIVVGARGLSAMKSVLLGSVSHAVSQHADRPVLIVHGHE